MSKIVKAFLNEKKSYIEHYKFYLRHKTGRFDVTLGRIHECEYVLKMVFGLTDDKIERIKMEVELNE